MSKNYEITLKLFFKVKQLQDNSPILNKEIDKLFFKFHKKGMTNFKICDPRKLIFDCRKFKNPVFFLNSHGNKLILIVLNLNLNF